jgi:hypothetical protein
MLFGGEPKRAGMVRRTKSSLICRGSGWVGHGKVGYVVPLPSKQSSVHPFSGTMSSSHTSGSICLCLELHQPLSSQASWFPGQLSYRASNLDCSLSQFRDCIRLPRKGIDCGFPYLQITASCISWAWTWRQASPLVTAGPTTARQSWRLGGWNSFDWSPSSCLCRLNRNNIRAVTLPQPWGCTWSSSYHMIAITLPPMMMKDLGKCRVNRV